jgi:predicted lipoprotein with Yx(FWY)xxD motif
VIRTNAASVVPEDVAVNDTVIRTPSHEETHHMALSNSRLARRAFNNGRIAAAVLVAGGLVTTVGVAGASGAVHSHTKSVVISTYKSAKLGTILVDGRTLYTLQPNSTACTAACHKVWIQVLLPKGVKKATAGAGVSAAKLGTVKVSGGALQVTYGGRALYWFFLDKSLGQVKGNITDTWGKWVDVVLVKPAGKPTTTTTSGGGGGVGF